MYGNVLGWVISAIIVAATIAGIAWIDLSTRATPADAFGRDAANAAPLQLPLPTALLSEPVDGPAGTTSLDAVIAHCIANLANYDAFARRGGKEDIPSILDGLDRLQQACQSGVGPIFASTPEQLITYENIKPRLQAVDLLGRVAIRAALLRRQSDPASADGLLRAVFNLGRRLFDERLTYDELDCGLRLLAESTAAMISGQRGAAGTDRLTQLEEFNAARLALVKTRILPVAERIKSNDGKTVAANAGNVRLWAVVAGDRVWRVEAILALGRARFFVGAGGTPGDQKAAIRVLNLLRNDPDPAIRLAAEKALSLTAEQYRLLR